MPLGRSSPLGFLLNGNGSGGSVEDNLHDFPRHIAGKFARRLFPRPAIERRGGARIEITSRGAPAALLGRPSGGRRESGGRPARGGRQPCPVGAPFRKFGRGGWAAEGLWGHQERQMGQKLPLCGQLGPTRSRQDESKEVGEVGSKRTSSGGNGGHFL